MTAAGWPHGTEVRVGPKGGGEEEEEEERKIPGLFVPGNGIATDLLHPPVLKVAWEAHGVMMRRGGQLKGRHGRTTRHGQTVPICMFVHPPPFISLDGIVKQDSPSTRLSCEAKGMALFSDAYGGRCAVWGMSAGFFFFSSFSLPPIFLLFFLFAFCDTPHPPLPHR
ncbi:hypothetical protein LX36DRAFT_346943 [Colletotrichum falcatum]|nr:hypothetical protein LX36DRAFT_346943 [Colletotrichum falcatum]